MYQHLIYALKNNESVSIRDVDRGLKCGCVCAACNDRLIARKGMKREHHFAHQSKEHCEYGYESSLHLMAKNILLESKTIVVPEISVSYGIKKSHFYFQKECKHTIKYVELERKVSDVIPDVVVTTDEGPLFIEIYVTHKIDDIKLEKLKVIGIPTLEIDLSWAKDSLIDEIWLSKYLLDNNSHKYWAYHPMSEISYQTRYHEMFYRAVDKRYYNDFNHVYGCPFQSSTFQNVSYTELKTCYGCDYYIEQKMDDQGNFILCNGRRKFETTKDLDYIQGTEEAIGQLVRGNMFDEAYEKAYNLRDKNRYKSRFPNIIKSKPVVSQEHQIIPVSKKELQIAKDILSHADQIMVPDVDTGCPLEMVIRDIKPDHYVDDVPFDAVLYTDDLSVGILFQTDDTCPDDLKSTGMSILTIDIRNAGSFTTKRQFVQSLLNDVSNKSWL